jgi:hypothetical protein
MAQEQSGAGASSRARSLKRRALPGLARRSARRQPKGLFAALATQLVAVETSSDAVVGEGISGESPVRTLPSRRLQKHQSLWLALVAIAGGRFGRAWVVESPARTEVSAFTARSWNPAARRLTRRSKATRH